MGAMASQITSLTIVYSSVYSGADKKKTSKLPVTGLCVRGIHRSSAQMASNAENFPVDDAIMVLPIYGARRPLSM